MPNSSSTTIKNILVVCPKGSFDSGGIISSFELIKYLRDQGHHIRVITPWRASYNTVLTQNGISNRVIRYNWWTKLDTPKLISRNAIGSIKSLADEIQKFNADVVLTNTSHIPWGALAASMMNIPHVWVVREYPIKNFEYLAEKVEFIKAYSNKIMANSSELADYYKQVYHCDAGRFMSYVDVSGIKLAPKSSEVKLISPNYMSYGKNQIDLVNAVGILKKRRKTVGFRVVLMGEKEKTYWPKLKAAVKKNNVADLFEIHDRVDNPWSIVTPNDVLVQNSRSESIGRTTTEAMKLGIPVIASDIPGHREAFRLGGGTLYEIDNPHDLADKIEYLITHHDDAKEKAQRVRERVASTMSRDACNKAVGDAVNEAAGSQNPLGANALFWPYLRQYISETEAIIKAKQRDIDMKNEQTDFLQGAIEELRGSKTYKLGKFQTDTIKKLTFARRRNKSE